MKERRLAGLEHSDVFHERGKREKKEGLLRSPYSSILTTKGKKKGSVLVSWEKKKKTFVSFMFVPGEKPSRGSNAARWKGKESDQALFLDEVRRKKKKKGNISVVADHGRGEDAREHPFLGAGAREQKIRSAFEVAGREGEGKKKKNAYSHCIAKKKKKKRGRDAAPR